jgi:hypothetical protein
LPVLDVDTHVSYEDLTDMWPAFQEILASFPNLRYRMNTQMHLCTFSEIVTAFLSSTAYVIFMFMYVYMCISPPNNYCNNPQTFRDLFCSF